MPGGRRLLTALLVLALAPAVVPPAAAAQAPGAVDAGNAGTSPLQRVIVRWRTGRASVARSDRAAGLAAVLPGVRHAAEVAPDASAWWLPEPRSGPRAIAALRALAAAPGVATVSADLHLTSGLTPNDPWYAPYQGDLAGTWGIRAPGAWDVTTGSPSVVVAVIDTGITPHPELASRVVAGYDFVSDVAMANDGDARDADASDPGDWVTAAEAAGGYFDGCPETPSTWHGTHVAGTIAAAGNNGAGVAGIAWGSRVLPVRVLGKCGGYASDIAAAIRWAAGGSVPGVPANPTPARVLNLSLGGPGECDAELQAAIDEARSRGATVVVAAGNGGAPASAFVPANCAGVVAVGALTDAGTRASFSNYGEAVDIAAPGVDIASTINLGTQGPGAAGYAALSGTSMAAPHVSGVVALMLAANPALDPAAVPSLLASTAREPAPDAAADGCATVGCGTGLVDAAAAVAAARSAPAPKPTPTPTPSPTATPPPADTTPPSLVSIRPAVASPYRGAVVPFALAFSEPVSGLAAADLTRSGTATGCSLGAPTGSGKAWSVAVSGCSQGTIALTLAARSVTDAAHNAGPAAAATSAAVRIDRTAPVVTAPAATLRSGATLAGTALPVRVAWTGSDAGGAGIARYELERSLDGGTTWARVASGTPPAVALSVGPAGTVRYRARAVDRAGNTGAWALGPSLSPRLLQQTSTAVRFGSAWSTVKATAYSGGSVRYARSAGASASYTFTGRSVALVSTRAPSRGKVRIYVDGAYAGTVDLYATTLRARTLVWQRTWGSSTRHTIRLVVAGTAGRPRVDVDAFAVLR